MNEVINNILTRRSCRAFTAQPVEQEKLEQIVTAAQWAPSGMNRQSWHFVMLSNPEKIQELAKAVGKADNRPENYNFYAPAAFLIIAADRDNRNSMLDASAALENAMLAAHSLGVASCWINQVRDVTDDPAVRALLTEYGVPENYAVYTAAALGYAEKETAPHERAEGTVSYIK
ncbi:MAG: nitroreductase family protein [Butyricicoccaceae bacterium]